MEALSEPEMGRGMAGGQRCAWIGECRQPDPLRMGLREGRGTPLTSKIV